MTREEMKHLLEYEIKHLIYKENLRKGIQDIFGLICSEENCIYLPSEDYEMLDLVLDNLNIPPDDEIARDRYNNIYIDLCDHLVEKGAVEPFDEDLEKLLDEIEVIKTDNKESNNNNVIFEKEYYGFEDISDLERDMIEAFDPKYNKRAEKIPGEFEGTVKITVTYEE